MKITVKTYIDGQEALSKVFPEGVYRVGRSEFSDIVLNHSSISRSHLEIRVTESAVYLTNMGAGGKVKVNGQAVETAEMNDGDEVRVGPFQIVVFHGEREGEAPSPAGLPGDNPADGGVNVENAFGGGEFQPNEGGEDLPVPAERGEGNAIEPVGDRNDDFQPGGGDGAGGVALAEAEAELEIEPNNEGTAMGRGETQLEIKPIVAKLIFAEGPKMGDEMFIETFEVTLGRSKKADIFLDDEKLSRIHCKVTRVGMGYRLVDMNSRNGTFVNGIRVLEHPLNSFDEIQIGNSKIKFLIHDVMTNEMQRAAGTLAVMGSDFPGTGSAAVAFDQTKSLAVGALPQEVLLELQRPKGVPQPEYSSVGEMVEGEPDISLLSTPRNKRNAVMGGLLLMLVIGYFLLPSAPTATPTDTKTAETTKGETKDPLANVVIPANMPKDYADLTPEQQRKLEGDFNAAIQAAQQNQYESAVEYLRRIHSVLPYYKNSLELQDQYLKIVKDRQVVDAQKRAKDDEKQDLQLYLEEGLDYLKGGDFERAAEAFNSAIVIDPANPTAIRGLKAAEFKVKSLDEIPAEKDDEQEKRKVVSELFQRAVSAFTNKSYQEAIDTAEKIRKIELRGDTQYLNEAKQIIDRARMLQKEEFEPFLIQAKEKYAEGDYNASRDLCEEMLKRDGSYDEAIELLTKSKKQLYRLAKEAYTYGYILESMNRIEEAKQYWNRAKNYVRPGDEYYSKITKKLDSYQ